MTCKDTDFRAKYLKINNYTLKEDAKYLNRETCLVEFIGIINMPQFKPLQETELLETNYSGMGFIEHPDGYDSKLHNTKVLFIDLKKHIK
jgi:hypothetical protein